MVDGTRHEHTSPRRENPVHQFRAPSPSVLAQHTNAIGAAVGGVAAHRILPQELGRYDDIEMRAGLPFRQVAAVWRPKRV